MLATFKCLLTGNTVTFEHQVDIDSMKGHPDYELVEDTPQVTPEVTPQVAPQVVAAKKMGRPSKAEQLAQLEVQ
jgi:hypothetical protein